MDRNLSHLGLPLLLALLAAPALASRIVPAQPSALQPVELRLEVDSCTFVPSTVRVAAAGATLRVTQQLNACLVQGTRQTYDVRLGAFPAGDYRVEVYASASASGTPAETLAFTVVAAPEVAIFPPLTRPLTDYTGLWWDPATPGFGVSLHQDPVSHAIFGSWYFYDGSGFPSWLTLQDGQWTSATRWSGRIFRSTRINGVGLTEAAGTAVLDFGGVPVGGAGTLTYAMPAGGGTITLVRFLF